MIYYAVKVLYKKHNEVFFEGISIHKNYQLRRLYFIILFFNVDML